MRFCAKKTPHWGKTKEEKKMLAWGILIGFAGAFVLTFTFVAISCYFDNEDTPVKFIEQRTKEFSTWMDKNVKPLSDDEYKIVRKTIISLISWRLLTVGFIKMPPQLTRTDKNGKLID